MDVVVVITEFKQMLAARGYSPATVEHYRCYLSSFNCWCKDNGIADLKQVTAKVLADYQGHVKQKPISTETQALHIRPVKRLFEYLVEAGRLLIDPAENIVETCRRNRKLGPVLGEDQVKRLLARPNLSTTCGLRDRAVLEVLYATAIRRNELLGLCVYDVNLKDKVLYIRKAKNRVQRVVPLTKTAAGFIKECSPHPPQLGQKAAQRAPAVFGQHRPWHERQCPGCPDPQVPHRSQHQNAGIGAYLPENLRHPYAAVRG